MNLDCRKHCWGAAAFGVVQMLSFSLFAQNSTNPAVAPVTNPVLAAQSAPLFPSPAKAPVEFFRALLAMSPVERTQALSYRTAQNQKLILEKVHEYEMLPPKARELRLSLTELQWYLLRLMPVAPTNRPARFAQVPPSIRSRFEARLKLWDKLTATQQAALLENEAVIRYFV